MSMYRKFIWYIKGLREYTKKGFEDAKQTFNSSDLEVDAKGLHYMITGANSGIGKVTAHEISKRGGTIHMVCRNAKTAEEAKQDISKETGNDNIFVHILDLSHTQSVVKFATEFSKQHDMLHVLINNAGCMVNTREVNESGHEKNFATNTLGTFVLTKLLAPLIEKTGNGRVITVSSGGMLVQQLDTSDMQSEKMSPFDGTMVYSQNKRQQVVMTEQFAKMWPTIHFSVMHPGWADTPAVRSSMPDFYEKMKDRLRTAEEGADTIVWLALSKAATMLPSGSFFQDRTVTSTHLPLARTRVSAEKEEEFMKILQEISDQFMDKE